MSKTLYDKLWDEHVVTAEGDVAMGLPTCCTST